MALFRLSVVLHLADRYSVVAALLVVPLTLSETCAAVELVYDAVLIVSLEV